MCSHELCHFSLVFTWGVSSQLWYQPRITWVEIKETKTQPCDELPLLSWQESINRHERFFCSSPCELPRIATQECWIMHLIFLLLLKKTPVFAWPTNPNDSFFSLTKKSLLVGKQQEFRILAVCSQCCLFSRIIIFTDTLCRNGHNFHISSNTVPSTCIPQWNAPAFFDLMSILFSACTLKSYFACTHFWFERDFHKRLFYAGRKLSNPHCCREMSLKSCGNTVV